jgi:antitoxin YefM
MISASLSDFGKDIKSYFDKVNESSETLIINCGKDKKVVIMSLIEYNSLLATQHELSSKENERRLDSAIEKFRKGGSCGKNLLEE